MFSYKNKEMQRSIKVFAKLTTNFLSTSNPALTFVNVESIDDGSACTQGVAHTKQPNKRIVASGMHRIPVPLILILNFT